MAAITSGIGLGLYQGSLSPQTGQQAALGQNGNRVFVNSTTGNLVIQQQDEFLSSLGLDLGLVRTYNSQGWFDDDNGDNWRLNIHQRLHSLTGTINTAGSTITKVFGDGFESVYSYDETLGLYVSTDGDGAHDTLSYSSGTSEWTWSDGTPGVEESYNASGQLLHSQDRDGNAITYTYTGNLITQITDASGQVTSLSYVGNNLASISTLSNGQTQLRTRYSYDAQDRLSSVTVDLSPEDADITDGNTYVTTYTYDGTGTRVASISGSDGSTVSFSYDAEGRVASVTDGAGQVTRYDYSTVTTSAASDLLPRIRSDIRASHLDDQGRIIATENLDGSVTSYGYDATGRLNDVTTYDQPNSSTTPLWQQDFSVDDSGFAQLYPGYTDMVNGRLEINNVNQANNATGSIVGSRIHAFSDGVTFRSEVTTSGSSDSRSIRIGIMGDQSAGPVQEHAIWLKGDALVTRYVNQAGTAVQEQTVNDTLKNNTTYVFELVTHSSGTTLYFYEKGQARDSGVVDARTSIDWQTARLAITVTAGPAVTPNTTYIDNLSESIGTRVANLYVQTSAGDSRTHTLYDEQGRVGATLDGQGQGTTYQYDANNQLISTRQHAQAPQRAHWQQDFSLGTQGLTFRDGPLPVVNGQLAVSSVNQALNASPAAYRAQTHAFSEQITYQADITMGASSVGRNFNIGIDDNTGRHAIEIRDNVVSITTDDGATFSRYTLGTVNDSTTYTFELVTHETGTTLYLYEKGQVRDSGLIDTFAYTGWGQAKLWVWTYAGSTAVNNTVYVDNMREAVRHDQFIEGYAFVNDVADVTTPYVSDAASRLLPVVRTDISASHLDDQGRVIATENLDGTLSAYRYDETGRLNDVVTYNQPNSSTPLWQQDFSVDDSGFTQLYPGYTDVINGRLEINNVNQASTASGSIYGSRSHSVSGGVTFRAEVTTSAFADSRDVYISIAGDKSAWPYQQHGIRLKGDTLVTRYVGVAGSPQQNYTLDKALKNNTSYVFELVVSETGTTLYFYEKGQARDSGVVDTRASLDWQVAQLMITVTAGPAVTPNTTYFDNLSEAIGTREADVYVQSSATDTRVHYLFDEQGRVGATRDAQGQVTTYQYDANERLISTRQHAQTPSTAIWEQDFSVGSQGLTFRGDPMPLVNGQLAVSSINQATSLWPAAYRTKTHAFDEQVTYQADITMGASSVGRNFNIGIDDNIGRHAIEIRDNVVSITTDDGATFSRYTLGTVNDSTTYTFELVTHETGTTLYLYEKGQARDSGLIDTFAYTGWGQAKLWVWTYAGSTAVNNTVYVDNMREAVRHDQFIDGYAIVNDDADIITPLDGQHTTVTDALGNVSTYTTDAQGQLIGVQTPAIDGNRHSLQYQYDTDGNLTQITDAKGNVTEQGFNANGTLAWQQDAEGNRIEYIYNNDALLTNELVYRRADPDGVAGAGLASDPIVTRYVYDDLTDLSDEDAVLDEHHLRYTISAEGRVSEYRYNAQGQRISVIQYTGEVYPLGGLLDTDTPSEQALNGWVSGLVDKTQALRIDSAYDFRGNLASTTTYASLDVTGAGVLDGNQSTTQFIYDQAGQLLQSIDANGVATTADLTDGISQFTYDGLGRLLTSTDALGRLTVNNYDDVNNRVATTLANGLTTTHVYDARGLLVSTSQSATDATPLGTSTYVYDERGQLKYSQDPLGRRNHILYDEAGRTIANIDNSGALSETVYDRNNQVIQVIAYGQALSAATLTSLIDTDLALAQLRLEASNADDRSVYTLYDKAGRPVMNLTPSDDNANLGYVSQTFYNGARQITDVIQYANAVDISALDADSVPDDLVITPDSVNDRHSRTFYSDDGLLHGSLDAEGYVTETLYDAAGRVTETIAYATQLTDATLHSSGDLAAIKLAIGTVAADRHAYSLYNGRGQVNATIDADGTLIEFDYDLNGNVTFRTHYDTPVTVVGTPELALLRPLPSNTDQVLFSTYTALNQVDSVTDLRQGTTTQYRYDEVGNRIATTVDANTSDVRTTRVRYDAAGRVRGELTPAGNAALEILLQGTPTPADIDAIWDTHGITHTYDAAGRRLRTTDQNGSVRLFYYDDAGRLSVTIQSADGGLDENGVVMANQGEVSRSTYNTFGQIIDTTVYANRIDTTGLVGGNETDIATQLDALGDAINDSTTTVNYTLRGAVKQAIDALGYRTENTYTAFGELDTITQQHTLPGGANSNPLTTGVNGDSVVSQFVYDQRGQQTGAYQDSAGLNRHTQTSYDAFGRVTQTTDGNGIVTTINYGTSSDADTVGRQIVTTTRAGLNTVTTYDAFGRTLRVQDANNQVTQYDYTIDTTLRTQILTVTTPEGIITSSETNAHGDTVRLTDGNGVVTQYVYDVNGNLDTVTEALGSADEVVSSDNTYDNANRLITTQDATGVITTINYDAANRLIERTVDPTGLNLTTTTQYDAKGQVLTTTDANGTVTETRYDNNGQVSDIIVDPLSQNPAGLNLHSQFTYDGLGNTLIVTDGVGTAEVRSTEYQYDGLNRRTHTIVDPGGLNLVTQTEYDANNNVIAVIDANNHVTRYVYDTNNRLSYQVDALGHITQFSYDNIGNETLRTVYARDIVETDPAHHLNEATLAATVQTGLTNRTDTVTYKDQTTASVYDTDSRLTSRSYAVGQAETYTESYNYDNTGNLIRFTNGNGDSNYYAYDALNRQARSIDAMGYIVETTYKPTGEVESQTTYMNQGSLPTGDDPNWAVNAPAPVPDTDPISGDSTVSYTYDAAGRMVSETNAYGGPGASTIEYTYDSIGNQTAITDPLGVDLATKDSVWALTKREELGYTIIDGGSERVKLASELSNAEQLALKALYTTRQEFDVAGNIIKTIDANQGIVNFHYDVLNRHTQTIVDPGGLNLVTQFEYDANDNIVAEIDANNNITRYVYDAQKQLTYTVNALGYITHFSYDNIGNETQRTVYARDIIETDPVHQLTEATVATTIQTSLTNRTDTVTFKDQTTLSNYDSGSRIIGRTYAVGEAEEYSEGYDYDAVGNLVRVTNGNGDSKYYAYDALGQQVRSIDAMGYIVETAYNAKGEVESKTTYMTIGSLPTGDDPNWAINAPAGIPNTDPVSGDRIISYTYDAAGRLETQTDPGINAQPGVLTRYVYDSVGNLIDTIEAEGLAEQRIFHRDYDVAGRIIRETRAYGEPEASTTEYSYDNVGNQINIIDPRGVELATQDSTWALAKRLELGYIVADTGGDRAKLVSELSGTERQTLKAMYTTSQEFDVSYRKIASVDPLGGRTETVYDAAGNIVKTIDPNQNVGYVYYDALNRSTLQIDPEGYVTQLLYNVRGKVVDTIKYANKVVGVYDENSILQILDAEPVSNPPPVYLVKDTLNDQITHAEYDVLDRTISITDAENNSESFEYDALGNVKAHVNKNKYRFEYNYDANGNKVSETLPLSGQVQAGATETTETVSTWDKLWANDEIIVGSPIQAKIAYDLQGNAIAVWQQSDGYSYSVYANRYDAKLGWQGAELLEVIKRYAINPEVDLDDQGNAMVMWRQGRDIHVRRYDIVTGWEDAQIVASGATGYITSSNFAIDHQGNALVVWSQGDGAGGPENIYANRYIAAVGWQGIELLDTATGDAYGPQISFDKQGNALVIWTQEYGAVPIYGPEGYHIYSNRYEVGQGWQGVQLFNTGVGYVGSKQIAYDDMGNALVVWTRSDGTAENIYANRYEVGVGWQGEQLLETGTFSVDRPRLSVNAQGNAIVAWLQYDGTSQNFYANRYVAGVGWLGAESLGAVRPRDQYPPGVSIDAQGNAMAVWMADDGSNSYDKIYISRYTAGLGWQGAEQIATGALLDTEPKMTLDEKGDYVAIWVQDNGTTNSLITRKFSTQTQTTTKSVSNSFSYDARGNVIKTTQAVGLAEERITSYVYDRLDRLVDTIEPTIQTLVEVQPDPLESATAFVNKPNSLSVNSAVTVTQPGGAGTQYLVTAEVDFDSLNIQGHAGATYSVELKSWSNQTYGSANPPDKYKFSYSSNPGLISLSVYASLHLEGNILVPPARTELIIYANLNGVEEAIYHSNEDLNKVKDVIKLPPSMAGAKSVRFRYARTTSEALANDVQIIDIPVITPGQFSIPVWNNLSYEAEVYDELGNKLGIIGGDIEIGLNNVTTITADLLSMETAGSETPHTRQYHDSNGNIIKTINARGATTYHYYDAHNNRIATVDAERYLHVYEYDVVGNKIKERTYANEVPLTTGGNPLELGTTESPENYLLGTAYRETEYLYDQNNNRIESRIRDIGIYDQANGNQIVDIVTLNEYDSNNNIIKIQDANGNTTQYVYDRVGNNIYEIDAKGYVTSRQYDGNGNVFLERQHATPIDAIEINNLYATGTLSAQYYTAEDRVSRYFYDTLNRLNQEIREDIKVAEFATDDSLIINNPNKDIVTKYNYDGMGNVTQQIAADGGITDYEYDGLDRLIRQKNPEFLTGTGATSDTLTRRETEITYDGVGNVIEETVHSGDAPLQVSSFQYDNQGNVIEKIDPNGGFTRFYYDLAGNVIYSSQQKTNAAGVVVTVDTPYEYDLLNRQIKTTQIASLQNQAGTLGENGFYKFAEYNAYGEIDKKGWNGIVEEVYEYDNTGRLVRTNKDDGAYRLFEYDANGNKTSETEERGLRRKEFTYDERNQLIGEYKASNDFVVPVDNYWQDVRTEPTDNVVQIEGYKSLDAISFTVAPATTTKLVTVNWQNTPGYGEGNVKVVLKYYDFSGNYYDSQIAQANYSAGKIELTHKIGVVGHVDLEVFQEVNGRFILLGQHANLLIGDSIDLPLQNKLHFKGLGSGINELSLNLWDAGLDPQNAPAHVPLNVVLTPVADPENNSQFMGWFEYDAPDAMLTTIGDTYYFEFTTKDAVTGSVKDHYRGKLIVTAGKISAADRKLSLVSLEKLHEFKTSADAFDVTRYQYNAFGELWKKIDPLGENLAYRDNEFVWEKRVNDYSMSKFAVDLTETQRQELVASYTTEYRYTKAGHLDNVITAPIDVVRDGYARTSSLETHYYYDEMGRNLGVRDANDIIYNPNNPHIERKQYDLAGNLLKEIHADNNVKSYLYDGFGNVRAIIDEDNNATNYFYDNKNQVVKFVKPYDSDLLISPFVNYRYNELGQRIGTSPKQDIEETVYYDDLGRVIKTVSAAGRPEEYSYIYDEDSNALVSWSNQIDGKGIRKEKDYFGKVMMEYDGGAYFSYSYDGGGRIESKTRYEPGAVSFAAGSGASLTSDTNTWSYAYNAAGQLKSVFSNPNDLYVPFRDPDSLGDSYTFANHYKYDANGNRIQETQTKITDNGYIYLQQTNATYDQLNRLVTLEDPEFAINYSFDANGNRTHLYASYLNNRLGIQDYWYQYDEMNRFTTIRGVLQPEQIVLGNLLPASIVAGDNTKVITYYNNGTRATVNDERYQYNSNGALTHVLIKDGNGNYQQRVRRWYDYFGNLVTQEESKPARGITYIITTNYTYTEDNLLLFESSGSTKSEYVYGSRNEQLHKWSVQSGAIIRNHFSYYDFEAKRLSGVYISGEVTSYNPTSDWKPGFSNYIYDTRGQLVSVRDEKGNRQIDYSVNPDGQILLRTESKAPETQVTATTNYNQHYFYFNGHGVGDAGGSGNSEKDYIEILAKKKSSPRVGANFDYAYQPVSDIYPGGSNSSYTLQTSDIADSVSESLQLIALSVWGDSSLWYIIAESNGLVEGSTLTEGMNIIIPNVVSNSHYNTSTFKVYNPGELLGNTAPTLPDPPPPPPPSSSGCGGLLSIIVVVVSVVVSVYTGGLATSALSGVFGSFGGVVAGSAIGSAAGSIAGQLTGMGLGLRSEFSWKEVAAQGITGGLTAGLGEGFKALSRVKSIPAWAQNIGKGIANNAVGQGVNIAFGLQERFDWQSVASAAISAPITARLSQEFAGPSNAANAANKDFMGGATWDGFRNDLNRNLATGFASEGVRMLVYGDNKPQWASVIGNAYGSAIGNAALAQTQGSLNRSRQAKAQAKLAQEIEQQKQQLRNMGLPFVERADGSVKLLYNPDDHVTRPDPQRNPLPEPAGLLPPVVRRRRIKAGDSFSGIARAELGANASEAAVRLRAQQLMQANPNLDPRKLQIGSEINLGSADAEVKRETIERYNNSNSEYQAYLDEQQQDLRPMTLEEIDENWEQLSIDPELDKLRKIAIGERGTDEKERLAMMIENKRKQLGENGRSLAAGLTEDNWKDIQSRKVNNADTPVMMESFHIKSNELGFNGGGDLGLWAFGGEVSMTTDDTGTIILAAGGVGNSQVGLTGFSLSDLKKLEFNSLYADVSMMSSFTAPAKSLATGLSGTVDLTVSRPGGKVSPYVSSHIGYTEYDNDLGMNHLIFGNSAGVSFKSNISGIDIGDSIEYSPFYKVYEAGTTGKVINTVMSARFETPFTLVNIFSNMNNYGYANKPITQESAVDNLHSTYDLLKRNK